MSAKIYDTTQQAFVDAETPKVHDGSTYVDADGKVNVGGTWEDAWNKQYYRIYTDSSVRDGTAGYDASTDYITQSADRYTLYNKRNNGWHMTSLVIEHEGYSTLSFTIDSVYSPADGDAGVNVGGFYVLESDIRPNYNATQVPKEYADYDYPASNPEMYYNIPAWKINCIGTHTVNISTLKKYIALGFSVGGARLATLTGYATISNITLS